MLRRIVLLALMLLPMAAFTSPDSGRTMPLGRPVVPDE